MMKNKLKAVLSHTVTGIINKRSLSKQLKLLIARSLICVILIQLVFFVILWGVQRDQLQKSVMMVSDSVEITFNSVLDDIKASAMAFAFNQEVGEFLTDEDIGTKYLTSKHINDLVKFVCLYNPEIHNIILINKSLAHYSFIEGDESNAVNQINRLYADRGLVDVRQDVFFLKSHPKQDFYDLLVFLMPVFGKSASENAMYEQKGYILFEMKTTKFYDWARVDKQFQTIGIGIYDKFQNGITIGDYQPDKMKLYTTTKLIDKYGITVKVVLDKHITTKEIQLYACWIITNILAFMALLLMAGYIINGDITKPLDQLVTQIRSLKTHLRSQKIVVNNQFEIKEIADEINNMLEQNREQVSRIISTQSRLYEIELALKESQLYALQAQINPHFLYNTLQSIRAIALLHGIKDIADIATAMARIFRYTINKDGIVPLKEEISFVNEYVKICCIRWQDKHTIKTDFSEELYELYTLKMLLQPIIENAVEHGLEKIGSNGVLNIKGFCRGDSLVFEITDNGGGMEQTKLTELNALLSQEYTPERSIKPDSENGTPSVGLANVNNRIKCNFGNSYGIALLSDSNGTVVTVRLPIINNL